ncbi:MAG: hypothetical protein KTR31_34050 [Myxococcales bacterium]|nr:hypothetical protein [Myxococcales bacterium]
MSGEPLLGITAIDIDGGSSGSVTVSQVQGNIESESGIAFGLHSDVPFVLGCSTADFNQAFSECGAVLGEYLGPGVEKTSVADLVVQLNATATVNTDTSDTGVLDSTQVVYLGLFANHRLLPGHVTSYDVSPTGGKFPSELDPTNDGNRMAATWHLVCGRGSQHWASCATDVDGDGYPTEGDCNEEVSNGSSIHPTATDPPAGTLWVDDQTDWNCDGWPVNFF